MAQADDIVFLFDVDNTLLDNDCVQAHLSKHLGEIYGAAARDRYFEILKVLVDELSYTDYLGALECYRIEAMHRPEHPGRGQEKLGTAGDHGVSQQGHYALDPQALAQYPPADIELARIGYPLKLGLPAFAGES